MDCTRAPSWWAAKGDDNTAPRTRKKLQKVGGSRQPRHGSIESVPAENNPRTIAKALAAANTTVTAATHYSIPLPPDLSDSKWLEYIRRSGYLGTSAESALLAREALVPLPARISNSNSSKNHDTSPESAPATSCPSSPSTPGTPPPKLAHLAASAARRHNLRQLQPEHAHVHEDGSGHGGYHRHRPPGRALTGAETWTRSEESLGHFSGSSGGLTLTSTRTRAKTPVYAIGQLEELEHVEVGNTRDNRVARERVGSNDNVELIAEQYRALLESRASFSTDSQSEPLSSPQPDDERHAGHIGGQSLVPRGSPAVTAHEGSLPLLLSPHSDDGTLVSFEEETIYFKPMSFSPEPTSPLAPGSSSSGSSSSRSTNNNNSHLSPRSLASPNCARSTSATPSTLGSTPENNSLQICLDLLTRELASSMSRGPCKSSALQIWVMIEAYGRLKGRLLEVTNLTIDEARPLHIMFDMWLRALYSIHHSITAESELQGLEETLD
ncbi:uncharacterized protein MKZ38_008146 [Zalerion maritima]|uniref:Uncharacterized protein n=1 Tax=Zalerion maritima TaxID=339359 RepID=A0AAD5RI21_9PEZI|nr:uncharacterized protein MKZ38_008146 [Zalerion maritima]